MGRSSGGGGWRGGAAAAGMGAVVGSRYLKRANRRRPRREENCFAGGGGDGTEAHLPNPPLPLLGHRAGRGFWAGAALPAVLGGGGPTPTCMAQNDPHVALIILTTHMCGKIFFVKKTFPGQNLWSGAFGGNIRPYRKQRARHGTHFWNAPSFAGRPCHPPPPPRKAIFGPPYGNQNTAGTFCP